MVYIIMVLLKKGRSKRYSSRFRVMGSKNTYISLEQLIVVLCFDN